MTDDLVNRLRDDRLMNPDYATRLEAADEIERLKTENEELKEEVRCLYEDAAGASL